MTCPSDVMKTHLSWFCACVAVFYVGTKLAKPEIHAIEKPIATTKANVAAIENPSTGIDDSMRQASSGKK